MCGIFSAFVTETAQNTQTRYTLSRNTASKSKIWFIQVPVQKKKKIQWKEEYALGLGVKLILEQNEVIW